MFSESGKLAGPTHAQKRTDKYSGKRLTFKSCAKEQSVVLTICV
jgi:hypothetical protein